MKPSYERSIEEFLRSSMKYTAENDYSYEEQLPSSLKSKQEKQKHRASLKYNF